MSNTEIRQASFIARKVLEDSTERSWNELIQNEVNKIKSCSTPASIWNNDLQTYNGIISPWIDLDNGEIYDIETGQTIGDL